MDPGKHTTHLIDPNLKYELWVIICLACVLLLTEFGLRGAESVLSGNLRHISQIPAIASKLGATGSSVLFLGNSLTNNAIDPYAFKRPYRILNDQSPEVVEKITPDGTALSDWYCIYRNHVATQRTLPDVVVMGFAWAQLSDQYPIDPARLGGFFCGMNDVNALSDTGLSRHDNLLVFMAGAVSHVYLNREAIRNRVLDWVVPNYRSVTQDLNINPGTQLDGRAAAAGRSHYTYETFRRFARLVNESGTRLVVVAMPVLEQYPLDPELMRAARDLKIALIDLRTLPDMNPSMFADPIHLNDTGRQQFSRILANTLEMPAH